jgi:hypothetical protein
MKFFGKLIVKLLKLFCPQYVVMTTKFESFKRVYFLSMILSIRYSEKEKREIFIDDGNRIYIVNQEKQNKTK